MNAEASAIKDAFATRLGFEPRFMLRAHDFDAPGALRPEADPAPPIDLTEPPIDPDELVEAVDAPPTDHVARLVADLGAEVVDERPRE